VLRVEILPEGLNFMLPSSSYRIFLDKMTFGSWVKRADLSKPLPEPTERTLWWRKEPSIGKQYVLSVS
jgi:hypothetical protein